MSNDHSEYWRGVNCGRARQEWAVFLASYSWDAFFTSTSKSLSLRRHPLSLISKVSGCFRSYSDVSRLFVAAEEFKLGDWHCHGLVKWNSSPETVLLGLSSSEVERGLSRIGHCRIEQARSLPAVSEYLSKYVIKTSSWEYDILGPGWGLDKPVINV